MRTCVTGVHSLQLRAFRSARAVRMILTLVRLAIATAAALANKALARQIAAFIF